MWLHDRLDELREPETEIEEAWGCAFDQQADMVQELLERVTD